jgi:RNA polymerase sigma-70 factor (ECF subfamily)
LGFATSVLGDKDLAEDVVQDSFLQVWKRADSYDPRRGAVHSWLFGVVHHRCIDVLRRQAARPRTTFWREDWEIPGAQTDTWSEVDHRFTRAAVRQALGCLPAEQREVIELGYFARLSQSQIADRLGLPLGTVKGRSRLALRRLRCVLQSSDLHPTNVQSAKRAFDGGLGAAQASPA